MNLKLPRLTALHGGFATAILLSLASAGATEVFSQTFDTGGTPGTLLDDTAVTSGSGTWQAGALFDTTGTITTVARSSAVVNFTPVSGNVYELTATVELTNTGFLGLGFANNISFTGASADPAQNNSNIYRFASTTNIPGTGWIMLNGTTNLAIAYSSGITAAGTPGTSIPLPTGPLNLKVVLDTTTATWVTTYYVGATLIGTSSFAAASNVIDCAGLTSGNGAGSITSFSLVTAGADTTAPQFTTLSPPNGATEASIADDLAITFDEPVTIGTGDITIKNLTDSSEVAIPVGNGQISVAGSILTINPTTDLLPYKNYAIQIAGTAIKDGSNNFFTGISDDLTWSFTTSTPKLRIQPVGDSITAGYTDNAASNTAYNADPSAYWNEPFEFGYRSKLYQLLTDAGYDFTFVGESEEPFNYLVTDYGDPTHGGTVSPTFDLRDIGPNHIDQDNHRGIGGARITGSKSLTAAIKGYLNTDKPDIVLLMIGINGISASSPTLLTDMIDNEVLTSNPFTAPDPAHLIVAQITPYAEGSTQATNLNSILITYNTHIRDTLVPALVTAGVNASTVDQFDNFLTIPGNPASPTDPTLYSNGINHPNNAAYNLMAQTWFEGILAVVPPTLPVLDETNIAQPVSPAATIGNFAQPPLPSTETLSFALVSGAGDTDNAKFTISGSQLLAAAYNFDLDPTGTTYSIRVEATGNTGGLTGQRTFTLTLVAPSNPDTDSDLIPDAWELEKTAPNPNLTDLGADPADFDSDGLSDFDEYTLSTGAYPTIDPTKADTDGDTLLDGDEINGAGARPPTDPTKFDTDDDDVSDFNEDNTGIYLDLLHTGTNPTVADSDLDGTPDGAEILQGTDPTDIAAPGPVIYGTAEGVQGAFITGFVAADDLLQDPGTSIAEQGSWETSTAFLTDGAHGGTATVEGSWTNRNGGSYITYALPTSPHGWDIESITSIADWTGGAFGNQRYTVEVRKFGETEFTSIASVDYQPLANTQTTPGGTKVDVSLPESILAGNVDQIRFTMLAASSFRTQSLYRELDVFGTQSASPLIPTPEIIALQVPSTSNNMTTFTWSSYPGKTYRVETSDTLSDWTLLAPALPSGGVTTTYQHDPEGVAPSKAFFRAGQNP